MPDTAPEGIFVGVNKKNLFIKSIADPQQIVNISPTISQSHNVADKSSSGVCHCPRLAPGNFDMSFIGRIVVSHPATL